MVNSVTFDKNFVQPGRGAFYRRWSGETYTVRGYRRDEQNCDVFPICVAAIRTVAGELN